LAGGLPRSSEWEPLEEVRLTAGNALDNAVLTAFTRIVLSSFKLYGKEQLGIKDSGGSFDGPAKLTLETTYQFSFLLFLR
jgi:hypothetical protein